MKFLPNLVSLQLPPYKLESFAFHGAKFKILFHDVCYDYVTFFYPKIMCSRNHKSNHSLLI